MKVVFNCGLYEFHKDHYEAIAKELSKRGHDFKYKKNGRDDDADFTITADEAQQSMGGKVVWIGHSFDAKGAMWNDRHCLEEFNKHIDYAFVYSKAYYDMLKKYFNGPIYITGMAKLDGLFGKDGNNILYAPTFDEELSADKVIKNLHEMLRKSGFGNVIVRRHPVFFDNKIRYKTCFRTSKIVISGYSSMGMEAIVLNKPTILVNNPNRFSYKSFPPDSYVCNMARKASIEVNNFAELREAILMYRDNPTYLSKERKYYGSLLCAHQGNAAKRIVNILEEILLNQ